MNGLVAEWQPLDRVEATVTCVPSVPGGHGGLFRRGTREALVRYGPAPPDYFRHVAAHELGHAWEGWNLTIQQFLRYAEIRGLDYTAATRDALVEDYAEVFAEIFGAPTPPEVAFASRLLSPVTPELTDTLCREELLPC